MKIKDTEDMEVEVVPVSVVLVELMDLNLEETCNKPVCLFC